MLSEMRVLHVDVVVFVICYTYIFYFFMSWKVVFELHWLSNDYKAHAWQWHAASPRTTRKQKAVLVYYMWHARAASHTSR